MAVGVAVAAAIVSLTGTPAHAATPGPYSIPGCTFSDGTTESSVWLVEESLEVSEGSGPDLTLIVDGEGYFYNEYGFVNKETGAFFMLAGGTRLISPQEGPPADYAWWVAQANFLGYWGQQGGYTADLYTFEWRYWATQGDDPNNQTSDTSGEPLCVIKADMWAPSALEVVGGEGGTVSADFSTVGPNDEVTLTATPDAGFTFSSWECTSGDIADPTSATTTVTNISADTTCTATFAPAEADEPDVAEELAATGTDNASSAVLLAGLLMVLGLGGVMLARATARTSR